MTACAVDAKSGRFVGVVKSKRSSKKASPVSSIEATRGLFHDLLASLGHPKVAGIAVENQEGFSSAMRGVPPSAMVALGQVAGALVCEALHEMSGDQSKVLFPLPQAWKGSIPKEVHQARVIA
jgi:hypothetical protein